jgi:hypothetical protein
MNIQELVDKVKDIALNKVQVKSFYVGNTWDQSAGKGDLYPCVWFEFPVLADYTTTVTLSKQFTFSLDVLDIPKLDNTIDEILKISDCEVIGDKIMIYLQRDPDFKLISGPTGLSVKSINADNACGIRIDIKVNTGRECLPR